MDVCLLVDNLKHPGTPIVVATIIYVLLIVVMFVLMGIHYNTTSVRDNNIFTGAFLTVTVVVFGVFMALMGWVQKHMINSYITQSHGVKNITTQTAGTELNPTPAAGAAGAQKAAPKGVSATAVVTSVCLSLVIAVVVVITMTANMTVDELVDNPPLLAVAICPIATLMGTPIVLGFIMARNPHWKTDAQRDDSDHDTKKLTLTELDNTLIIISTVSLCSSLVLVVILEAAYFHGREPEDANAFAYVLVVGLTLIMIGSFLYLAIILAFRTSYHRGASKKRKRVKDLTDQITEARGKRLAAGNENKSKDREEDEQITLAGVQVANEHWYGVVTILLALITTGAIPLVVMTWGYSSADDPEYHPSYVGLLIIAAVCIVATLIALILLVIHLMKNRSNKDKDNTKPVGLYEATNLLARRFHSTAPMNSLWD